MDRLYIAHYNGDKCIAESVSTVHCPDHEDERKRIEQFGGRILSMQLANGVQSVSRVYNTTGNLGGLAMSRSVGDLFLQRYGVISEPDLYEKEIHENTIGVLIGSDGLTTNCSMANAFSTILSEKSPQNGVRKLAKRCFQHMLEYSDHRYVDDISGVYIQIHPIDTYQGDYAWVDRMPLSQSPLWSSSSN